MLTSYPQVNNIKKAYRAYLKSLGYSNSSIKNYSSDTNNYLSWLKVSKTINGDNPYDAIRATDANEYRKFLISNAISTNTINRRLASLRRFSEYLQDSRNLDFDLTLGVSNIQPSPNAKKRGLKTEYTKSLLIAHSSKNTVKNYSSDISHFFNWLELHSTDINKVSTQDVYCYLDEIRGQSSLATLKRKLSSLRNFFQWAVKANRIDYNPLPDITSNEHNQKVDNDNYDPMEQIDKNNNKMVTSLLLTVFLLTLAPVVSNNSRDANVDKIIETTEEATNKQEIVMGLKTKADSSYQDFLGIPNSKNDSVQISDKDIEISSPEVTITLDGYYTAKYVSGDVRNLGDLKGTVINVDGHPEFLITTIDKSPQYPADSINPNHYTYINSIENTKTFISGESIIFAGQSDARINDNEITASSTVHITPTTNTGNNVLYIEETGNGYFKVGVANTINRNISFNWWAVK